MGKKGRKSKRGIGEKDEVCRNKRIAVWATPADAALLENAARELGISKTDIIIQLIRTHLRNHDDTARDK